jgi:O-succinylbenzoate synthase
MDSGGLLGGRRIEVFSLQMTTRFRGVASREGALIFGPVGVGEFSPFWDYGADESAVWLSAALEAADEGFPSPRRDLIPVNCTVPAVDPAAAAATVRRSGGCQTAKVKVAEPGQSLDDDVARVAAVREALGEYGRIRVDANGAWSVSAAAEALAELAAYGLEYAEQPVATIEEMRELRRRIEIPVAADESIRRSDDPLRVSALEAADIAVLKVQPLGGVRACLRVAEAIALPVVVSSALESSVGLAGGLALAAALDDLPYACGLATTSLLADDLVGGAAGVVDGCMAVRAPRIDEAAIDRNRADADTERRWLRRVADCERALVEAPR